MGFRIMGVTRYCGTGQHICQYCFLWVGSLLVGFGPNPAFDRDCVMFIKRADMKQIIWLHKIVPLKIQSKPLRLKRRNWGNIEKREFRSLIVRISIREKRSWPGAVRSYWRHMRFDAIRHFEENWSAVPKALRGWHVPPNRILYKSEGWSHWATA